MFRFVACEVFSETLDVRVQLADRSIWPAAKILNRVVVVSNVLSCGYRVGLSFGTDSVRLCPVGGFRFSATNVFRWLSKRLCRSVGFRCRALAKKPLRSSPKHRNRCAECSANARAKKTAFERTRLALLDRRLRNL